MNLSSLPKLKDERVIIQTEDGDYVGSIAGKIALTRNPMSAFVYDRIEDHVRIQIEEVYRLYGKVWKAVPYASVFPPEASQ
jgi:phage terminase small subunit